MTAQHSMDALDNSTEGLALSVENVSKSYGLWTSPGARLNYPMLNLTKRLLPAGALRRRLEKKTESMFHEFRALEDVSFQVRKGESWGIIGVNGSGKSTLLKIVSGNLRPSSGRVEVDGKVAILDYTSGLHADFTGRENVYMKGTILGLSRRQIESKFESIAAFADIGEFIDQPVKTYSSGMTARLGFAIMAHVDADIIITDEALAVGDAFFVQKSMRFIHSFLARGTFLFVSHSTHDVMTLCDKALWLQNGRVVAIGNAKDVCRSYLNSIERRTSREFLQARTNTEKGAKADAMAGEASAALGRISLSAQDLANLQSYFSPPELAEPADPGMLCRIDKGKVDPASILARDAGVGGARIFSASLVNPDGLEVSSFCGGEELALRVSAIAERPIASPIIGFQIKNNRGLALIAYNSFDATKDRDVALAPGQVFTATFKFRMPLFPMGEYMIRVGFADGAEHNNALLDVSEDAILVRCETSGVRHGLVGIPLLGIEIDLTHEFSEVVGFGG